MMVLVKWFITVLFVLGSIGSIMLIDKPRQPTGRGVAVISVAINILVIWYIWAT